jgi:hypothetical protein
MSGLPNSPLPSSSHELEALIRRLIREELGGLLERAQEEIEEEDEILAREGLAILAADRERPEAWMSWEDAKAELARAEAAGELPD